MSADLEPAARAIVDLPDMETHPRYRVESRSTSSGGFGELEEKTTFDVIDGRTGAVVLTFTGDYSAEYRGGPGWQDGTGSGVRKVEFAEDGAAIVVHRYGSRPPERIPLPE